MSIFGNCTYSEVWLYNYFINITVEQSLLFMSYSNCNLGVVGIDEDFAQLQK